MILLGSSKTCIFPFILFTGSFPLIEKLSSLLARLDIESSRTLPPAWTESRVMLVLPADLGLWLEVISRWESITINRLNNQTWSDNKAKLAFVENLLGESEKLMWQQWRTAYLGAYSALEAIADEPQNITSQELFLEQGLRLLF
ncbi:hypothetical protein Tco_0375138 [Tanacetum coccineum]